jgi:hypothetical protein
MAYHVSVKYTMVPNLSNTEHKRRDKYTITKISEKPWDEISSILPTEKPNNMIDHPIIPYRKLLDCLYSSNRMLWKMLPKEYCSGSTCHRRFQKWVQLDTFKKIITLLKE